MKRSCPLSTDRRAFLQHLLAASTVSMSGSFSAIAGAASCPASPFASSTAPFDGPMLLGGFNGTLETPQLTVTGRLPAALKGTLYRNGPARFKLGATQYRHWFDGDGMVQSFRFEDGRVSHRGVLLNTPKRAAEDKAGRFLYSAFGTAFADSLPISSPDALNVANINLLPMKGGQELYALWEAGSALQIDPKTLQAQGFKAWSPQTTGMSFSAHPRRAPDGTVWNFGYAAHSGKLVIYQIGADGQLVREALLDAPQADMVHDFAITQHHLVFLLMPLHVKPDSLPVGDLSRFEWRPEASLVALVVSKADFSVKRFELPNGGVFHLGNAWEEGGVIRLSYARYVQFLPHLLSLQLPAPQVQAKDLAEWTAVTLDLKAGKARQTATGLFGVEFPSFDARFTGERTTLTVMMQKSQTGAPQPWGFDTVVVNQADAVQRYRYDAAWVAEEHILVPRPGSDKELDGWVLGTAYNTCTHRTQLSVFEARHVAQGPVAQMALPYGLPLGLHGQFVPA